MSKPSPVAVVRLRTVDGHTVIEDIELDGETTGPSWLSNVFSAGAVRFRKVSEPFEQSAHPAPRRQIGIILEGRLEVEVSSGERRQFGPGAVVFLEDTTGSGHITRILEPSSYVEIHLA